MIKFLSYVLVFFCLTCARTFAAPNDTSLQFDTETGLFVIKHHTVDIAKAKFIFWSGAWVWNAVKVETRIDSSFNYGFSGANKESGLTLNGLAKGSGANHMRWRFHVSPGKNQFGGIGFAFEHAPFANDAFVPELNILPGKDGWTLKLAADQMPIKVVIEPPPSDVIFERNGHDEIRVYFAKPGEKFVARDYTISVELPEGSPILPSTLERLAQPDNTWYNNLVDTSISPVNLSFLNDAEKPAGKHGSLEVKGDELVFSDGTAARFWGTNITGYSLFTTGLSDTVKQAKRLSELGFNLVRLHHFDSDWVKPNIFASDTAAGLELDKESLRRLDLWIKALGDEGIYVWLDLNVGRIFPASDGEGSQEMIKNGKGPSAAGYAYLDSGIEAKMKVLNALLLNHVNQYTKLAYRDDPRIAFLLLTNENDLTHHYGNMFLPDKDQPFHNKIFMAEATRFATEKGIDPQSTWESWKFGLPKLFLSDMEHRFNERMIAAIRLIGSKAVISTTNSFGNMTVAGLLSIADGGVVAVNAYTNVGLLEADPRYLPNLTSWIAATGLAGKPVAITEWNLWKHPTYDRSALPAYFAAIASFQGWNAPMEFAYSQSSLDNPGIISRWEFATDPALLAMMPVGALIFRQQHVKQGGSLHYLSPTMAEFINSPLSPLTSQAIRTLTETKRWRLALPVIRELDWFKPSAQEQGATEVKDIATDFAGSGDVICAETGDFCRNWRRGTFTVDTPMTQLASGWIGGETFTLKSVTIAIKTAYASLAIQSLDSKPIEESQSILISMAAQTIPAWGDFKSNRSEPVLGKLAVKARPGLVAYAAFGDGRLKPLSVRYGNGAYNLNLDATLGTYWIVLRDG